MNDTADEVDEIISNLVSEAEAHVLSERHEQPCRGTNPSDPANSTWNGACSVKSPADAYPVITPTGSAFAGSNIFEVQQPLSTNHSPSSASSGNNSSLQTGAYVLSKAFAQQQASQLQQTTIVDTDSAEGLLGKTDVPESVAKNSKLLALKQRRLGSLNSSLDLSRESSLDSATHAPPNDTAATPQSSFAGPVAHDSTSAMQANAALNEQASITSAPLPLDSTTGIQAIAVA